MKIKFRIIKIYFYILLTISICISFFGNNTIDVYGQILYLLSTTPVFGILYKISFNQFSEGIENKRPDLFDKYKNTFGVVERINVFEIFNNSDFDKLDDKELNEKLKLTKQLLNLTIKSFIVLIILVVCFIIFKR